MPGPSAITALAAKKKFEQKRLNQGHGAAQVLGAFDADKSSSSGEEWESDDEDDGHLLATEREDIIKYGPQYVAKKKVRKDIPKHREEKLAAEKHARAKGVRTVLRRLLPRDFATFEEFDDACSTMCAANNTSMSVRSSNTTESRNGLLIKSFEQASLRAQEQKREFKQEVLLVPETHEYYQKVYMCVHAQFQPDRVAPQDRQRHQAATMYTGCKARVTGELKRVQTDENGGFEWRVVVRQENTIHNHACTPAVFASYMKSSEITEETLFEKAAAQISVGGNSRQIRDGISAALGRPFSQRQFSNLRNYRLGGGDAEDNLDKLLEQFTSIDGNRCIVVHDQDDLIIGIILQTSIQHALYLRYGDSLQLDWTHNTNNLGYYLGCLMATSVTGKGVPVLDFLCLTQSIDMMKTVLEVFVEDAEAAADIVESFVIDKDYKEWKAVNEVFADASVVLCQFHVLKWFKTVVSNPRHAIDKVNRPLVLQLVRNMIYAETANDFDLFKSRLTALLPSATHSTFQDYMQKRWYECQQMWANHVRGKIFTAGNTTTNRLESHWNQFKAALGKKRRIDRCVEAILLRETAILRRELQEITEATTTTRLLTNEHSFVRSVFQDLSVSRLKIVKDQWVKFLARTGRYYCPDGVDSAGVCHVYPSSSSSTRFQVKTQHEGSWTCTCRFASSHRLPCRHQFFVAQTIMVLESFPPLGLWRRWSMSAAADLLESLEEAAESLGTVRLRTVVTPRFFNDGVPVEVAVQIRNRKKPSYRVLRRFERGKVVVLDAIEKRNIAEGQCDRVVSRLVSLGTAAFWEASAKLESVLSDYLASLAIDPPPLAHSVTADEPAGGPSLRHDMEAEEVVAGAGISPGVDQEMETEEEHSTSAGPGQTTGAEELEAEEIVVGPSKTCDVGHGVDPAAGVDGFRGGESDDEGYYGGEYANAALDSASDVDEDDDQDVQADENTMMTSPAAVQTDDFTLMPSPDYGSPMDFGHDPLYMHDAPVFQEDSLLPHGPVRFPKQSDNELEEFIDEIFPSAAAHESDVLALSRVLSRGSDAVAARGVTTKPSGESGESPPGQTRGCQIRDILNPDEEATDHVEDSTNGTASDYLPLPPPVVDPPQTSRTDVQKSNPVRKRIQNEGGVVGERTPKQQKRGSNGTNSFTTRGLRLPGRTSGAPRNSGQQGDRGQRLEVPSENTDSSPSDSKLPDPIISVSQLVDAVRHAPLSEAREISKEYPREVEEAHSESRLVSVTHTSERVDSMKHVLSRDTVEAVVAAILTKRVEHGVDHETDVAGGGTYVASIHGTSIVLSERDAESMAAFYRDRHVLLKIGDVRDWLDQTGQWAIPERVDVPFLDEYARECATDLTEGTTVVQLMRDQILNRLEALPINTVIEASPRGSCGVAIREFVSDLAQRTWLNDSTVFLVASMLAARYSDVVVIDPVHKDKIKIPAPQLKHQRVVVFPLNYSNLHWCVICVVLDWNSTHKAYVYDPRGEPRYVPRLDESWESWVLPLLQAWFKRDEAKASSSGLTVDLTDDSAVHTGSEVGAQ